MGGFDAPYRCNDVIQFKEQIVSIPERVWGVLMRGPFFPLTDAYLFQSLRGFGGF